MAVAMLVDNPDVSVETYRELTSSLSLDGPVGGRVHIAGPGPCGGWRVIEVWSSVEEASRFLEDRLLPALAEAGLADRLPQPQFWPVHACMTADPSDEGGMP